MKQSAIFLRAARHVFKVNDFSCLQVSCAERDLDGEYSRGTARVKYGTMFGLEQSRDASVTTRNTKRLWDLPYDEQQEVRVMMLCFAAAMSDAGDL